MKLRADQLGSHLENTLLPVYLVSGEIIVGNDEHGEGGERFNPPTYACRPPGIHHGPFKSDTGCLLFELHYYVSDDT